ncbi:RDD family protein [Alteromonas halophila]|uniref:RDD family protein n=1 Tax=Alteromonas halophila TaxID=516698 RepID=A0A918JNN6_9ALTE|nr:RDD family protein [Alteromonas halophila]GGW93114.1 RDD family protein [Alteromonas halophila]
MSTSPQESAITAPADVKRAGFIRRLLAMVYDTLVAIAIGMCAGLVIIVTLVILLKNGVLDMQGFEQPSQAIQASLLYTSLIQGWVAIWVAGFFIWFWKNGGQTLGMRAWRLRIYSTVDKPVTWSRMVIRLIGSLGGLGTLLVLFDIKHRQSLQDRLASTEVVQLTKAQNDHKSW